MENEMNETSPALVHGTNVLEPATSAAPAPSVSRAEWIATFHEAFPPYVVGDDAATTFACCGAILLFAALFETKDSNFLTEATSLPEDFVVFICHKATQKELWSSDCMLDLKNKLAESLNDLANIEASLMSLKQELWDRLWAPELVLVLEYFRDGKLVGGQRQAWHDIGFEEEFGAIQISAAG
jgi:hypothetical protein